MPSHDASWRLLEKLHRQICKSATTTAEVVEMVKAAKAVPLVGPDDAAPLGIAQACIAAADSWHATTDARRLRRELDSLDDGLDWSELDLSGLSFDELLDLRAMLVTTGRVPALHDRNIEAEAEREADDLCANVDWIDELETHPVRRPARLGPLRALIYVARLRWAEWRAARRRAAAVKNADAALALLERSPPRGGAISVCGDIGSGGRRGDKIGPGRSRSTVPSGPVLRVVGRGDPPPPRPPSYRLD